MRNEKFSQVRDFRKAPEWGSKASAAWEYMTPEKFQQVINQHCFGNRNEKTTFVKEYVRLMEIPGEWDDQRWVVSPMAITTEGKLRNGANRARAAIKAGYSGWVYVVRNIDPKLSANFDDGAPRSVTDKSLIDLNVKLAPKVPAIANILQNGNQTRSTMSKNTQAKFAVKNGEVIGAVLQRLKGAPSKLINQATGAALVLASQNLPIARFKHVCNVWVDGQIESESDRHLVKEREKVLTAERTRHASPEATLRRVYHAAIASGRGYIMKSLNTSDEVPFFKSVE
jgi:hypothetical protein